MPIYREIIIKSQCMRYGHENNLILLFSYLVFASQKKINML